MHAGDARPHQRRRHARYPTGGNEPILTVDGERIVDAHGRVSRVTTAGAAPSLDSYLLLAYLPPEHAVEGNELRVMYMNELFPVRVARVGSQPLFDPDDTRMKTLRDPRLREAGAGARGAHQHHAPTGRPSTPRSSASRRARTRSARVEAAVQLVEAARRRR